VSAARLNELLSYDPAPGVLRWKVCASTKITRKIVPSLTPVLHDEAAMATYAPLTYSVCTTGLLLPAYF